MTSKLQNCSKKLSLKMAAGEPESGAVLVTTLIILVLLTVIGVSGINMATTDLQITRNYRVYKENLYKAEAAVMQLAQKFENVPDTLSNGTFGSASMDDAAVNSKATQESTWSSNAANAMVSHGQFMWCPRGVPGGTSLSLSKSTPHDYFLYGRGTANEGEVIVKIGYRKAF